MKKTTLKRITGYLMRAPLLLFAVFGAGILANVLGIFGPLLIGKAVDQITGANEVQFQVLAWYIGIILALYGAGSAFQWIMAALSNRLAQKAIREIRQEAFEHLQVLPLRYLDQTAHGSIINRLTNDIDAIAEGLLQGIMQMVSAVIIIVGSFVFMMSISPVITGIVLLITPLCFFIASFIAKRSRLMYTRQSMTTGDINGYVEEMIGNQKVVKAFGQEENVLAHFTALNEELYHWGQQAQWYSSLTNPTTRLINNIAYVAVTVAGGLFALAGHLSVGNIASFLTYSNQFAKPINEITSLSSQIQSAFASAERVFQLIDEPQEKKVDAPEAMSDHVKGCVDFEGVTFGYESRTPIIRNLNLAIRPGTLVAIVGPTGSGKTTLVNLLMRYYDIQAGDIRIDDQSIYRLKRQDFRTQVGMVLQESWLFSGTIAENIAYAKPDATIEEITAAAKEAHAHGFIRRLPKGYDTMIEENGGNLSGGEKQLLTIARVMLIDPAMLILDEATSNIDTRTEQKIQDAFHKMMENRTSFVIAHRLATIREADIILVLKDGDIIEKGTHHELLARKGFYYTMYHSQFATT